MNYMQSDGPNHWTDNVGGRVKVYHDPFDDRFRVAIRSANGLWRTAEHRHKTSESAIGHANMIVSDWVEAHNNGRRPTVSQATLAIA